MNDSDAAFVRIKELLEKGESFPLQFSVKLIGKQEGLFKEGVAAFLKARPRLSCSSEQLSSNGRYVSYTLTLLADHADEVIALMKQVREVPEVAVVL